MLEIKVHQPDTKVFAINRMFSTTKGKITNNITIYEAIVESVTISMGDKTNTILIEYWLKTPKGESWGDCIPQSEVSDNFDDLIKYIKPIWLAESNTFGD